MRHIRTILTFSLAAMACLFCLVPLASSENKAIHEDKAFNDVAVLSNGSQVSGKITEAEIDGKRMVIIEMENGMKMTLRRSQISQLRLASQRLAAYEAEKQKMTDDLAGH